MTAVDDARYRLGVARQLVERAQRMLEIVFWREAALFARGAIEHAAKAILACFTTVSRTHDPDQPLQEALADPTFPP